MPCHPERDCKGQSKGRRVLALVAVLALFSVGVARAGTLASADDMRSVLATYVAAYPKAAVAAGVVDGTNVSTYFTSGPTAVDENTVFQIGSVTKTFTGTLLAQMVLAHEVALDDPIAKYLPAGVTAPSFEGKPITLLTLAEQTSGLPRLPANLSPADWANPYAEYTPAAMYAFLSHYKLTRAPGAQYEYSNYGVTLLGQLLANGAGKPYAQLIEERILRPLGMTHTTVTGTAQSRASLVAGYSLGGTPKRPWDFGTLGAAGSIESSLHDMLIYLKANLAAPEGPLGPAMALAQQPRMPVGLNGILRIGLLWQSNVKSGITFHNGEAGGFRAWIGYDRATHQGVVVLGNITSPDIDTIGTHALAPYIPAPQPPPAAALEASPYGGAYVLSPAFAITVYKTGGKLFAQATGQPALPLQQTSPTVFTVQGVDAKLVFELDSNGVANAVTLQQNGLEQRGEKEP